MRSDPRLDNSSPTKRPAPVPVVASQPITSTGSGCFDGLKEDGVMSSTPDTRGSVATSDNVVQSDLNDRYVASVTTTTSGPTNWFELGAQLCYEGRISPERLAAAALSVRQGVKRD